MDKVDAKTRETAATLLDVLWTSKVVGEAVIPLAAPALTGTSNPSTVAVAACPVNTFPSQVATNNRIVGKSPITAAPRHGFDTNGWGNETTVQRPPSTHPIGNKPIIVNSASNMIEDHKKVQKQEHDTQTISQQQHRQPQSENEMPASSSASALPSSAAHNQDHQMQHQSQEKLLKQPQRVGLHQNQQPSTHLQQNNLLQTNSTSIISTTSSSNTASPMMISLTSIGFGIDNNNISRTDATEATIKAVQDAMERSTLQFQTLQSHPLQIKIRLGVPSVVTAARTSNSLTGSSDSKRTLSQIEMQPMNVDLARLSSILPRVIPILPVQVELGGMFIPGENPAAPSICTVVACITLESQPQPSSKPQPQPQLKTSPRAPVAPPLLPYPSLSPEPATSGLQKPEAASVMESTSKTAIRMINAPTQKQEVQQLQQHNSKITHQPMNLLPISTSTFQERLVGDPVSPQQWPAGNSPEKACVSETTALPSSSLLYRTQLTTASAASPSDQIEKKTTAPISSNNCNTVKYTTSTGQKRPFQQEQCEVNKKKTPQNVHGSNGSKNSIEILAMISEQEINRRNVLGANGNLKPTPSSTTRVLTPTLSTKSPASDMHNSSAHAGIVMTDSRTTFQGANAMGESRHNKSDDRVLTPEVSFVATRHNDTQTIGCDQSNSLNENKKNSKNVPKNVDNLLKTEGTFTASETNHFITPAFHQKKHVVEKNTSTISTTCTTNLTNSANVRKPPHLISRQSKNSGGSRGGGRSVSYLDYSNEHPLPEERDCWALSTRTTSSPVFPLKLHETLTQIEKDGFDDIIGWLPHGRSFKIHKQKEFTDTILPRYFVMTKKSSFLRQLNLYSFNRFSAGTFDKGSYYHEKFLRGKKFLSRRMTRQKVNGNRIRSAGNPDEEPDLSMYPICRDDDININSKHRLSLPSTSSSASAPSLIATSGITGRVIVSTGSTSLSSQTASSQQSLMHAAPTTPASDASVGGTISSRNGAVGASSFLRVL